MSRSLRILHCVLGKQVRNVDFRCFCSSNVTSGSFHRRDVNTFLNRESERRTCVQLKRLKSTLKPTTEVSFTARLTTSNESDREKFLAVFPTVVKDLTDAGFGSEMTEAKRRMAKLPASEEEWLKIAKEYEEKWNFPRCLGAVDGRHIDIVAPHNSGTVYFNYKERFSIVLLAIADASYRIIYADVGTQGRISDGGVLKDTTFYKMLETKTLNIPPLAPLPGRSKPVPYVFVADEAFALEENIVKPFAGHHEKNSWQRIFNYRACRARRVIENVFGIISAV